MLTDWLLSSPCKILLRYVAVQSWTMLKSVLESIVNTLVCLLTLVYVGCPSCAKH